jgi:hypothetical protein
MASKIGRLPKRMAAKDARNVTDEEHIQMTLHVRMYGAKKDAPLRLSFKLSDVKLICI